MVKVKNLIYIFMIFVTSPELESGTPTLSVNTRTRTWIDRIVTTVLLIIEEHLPPHPSDIISWRWYTIPSHINITIFIDNRELISVVLYQLSYEVNPYFSF